MLRAFGILLFLCATGIATLAPASPAEGAITVKVCGSGSGHGVGLSQYGAYGRAKTGQGFSSIIASYYRGAYVQRYADDPTVRVMLQGGSTSATHDVVVPSGGSARARNLATGGAVALGPGVYRVQYLSGSGLYRLADVSSGRVLGSYTGPLRFEPVTGFLSYGGRSYRGSLVAQVSGSGFYIVNYLPVESYVRGVVANEMPSSWPAQALESQAVVSRSYARASGRSGPYDLTISDEAYRGVSSETAATDAAVSATARVYATYGGRPIRAFYSAADGGYSEDAAYVFGATPYLKAIQDVDGGGRSYEGTAYARSPWSSWSGVIDVDGSPELGVGAITGVRVLERSPSGRATKVEVSGTGGSKTVYGEYEVRRRLNITGIRRADGSSYPAGDLPSARVSFGAACG